MDPADVLLYLPFPYWIGSVLVMYRHDLSRLFHPVRDNGSLRNWWYVLGYLGLLGPEDTARPSVKREVLPYVAYLGCVCGREPVVGPPIVSPALVLSGPDPSNLWPDTHGGDDAVSGPTSQEAIRRRAEVSASWVENKAPPQDGIPRGRTPAGAATASPAGDGTLPASADPKDQGGAK